MTALQVFNMKTQKTSVFRTLQYFKLIWTKEGEIVFETLGSMLDSFEHSHKYKNPVFWLIFNFEWLDGQVRFFQFRPKNSLITMQSYYLWLSKT